MNYCVVMYVFVKCVINIKIDANLQPGIQGRTVRSIVTTSEASSTPEQVPYRRFYFIATKSRILTLCYGMPPIHIPPMQA